ncbi:MAG TPA: lysophospholipid acyltransferase family protein [Xanthobacteraceae bacterium]|nr:lysophospholipid acyltransferase family protein [Xanthobacteraceae bacterium]
MSFVKRVVGSRMFQRAVGITAAEYLRLVWMTTRFAMEPEDFVDQAQSDFPVIVGVWHGHHLLLPFMRRYVRRPHVFKVLISRHRDGEINAIAAEHLGVGTIRGSGDHGPEFARKGGVGAFRQMLAALAQGASVTLTADVPKVARISGEGIVRLAAMSGRPIYLLAIATRNCIVLDNWDRTEISLPFGRGGIVGRGPIRVGADADADALERARQTVERELEAATLAARELARRPRRGLARD